MQSVWVRTSMKRQPLTGMLAALVGLTLGGCSESNEGNITTPPPPFVA